MKAMRTTVATVVAATLSMSAFSALAAASLTGAGATFPAPVYAKWADTYQKETGIAGYTLTYNSYGLILSALEPFESTEAAIEREIDIHSDSVIVRHADRRKLVGDTDTGAVLREKIADLEQLLMAYHSGLLVERYVKN